MHRNEGENMTSGALFPTSPPYGVLSPEFMNAVQEELMAIVVQNNLPLLSKDNDTKSQVWEAIKKYVDSLTVSPPDYRGWILDNAAWTYVSADAPSYIFNRAGNVTGIIYVGQKIMYYQDGAWKFGIVTAIGVYAAGVTPITIYAGGNTASPAYAMTASAISTHYYAGVWRPLDFPMNPDTWSYIVTDTSSQVQSSPSNDTWYNLGSILINVPIGLWNIPYNVLALIIGAGAFTASRISTTLSTVNNSESNSNFTYGIEFSSPGAGSYGGGSCIKSSIINLTSKTPYYLNTKVTGGSITSINNGNNVIPLTIKAICQYL